MDRCAEIAKMIDHSLLRPYLTQEEITSGLEVAKRYHCATVCVHPEDVARGISRGIERDLAPILGALKEGRASWVHRLLGVVKSCIDLPIERTLTIQYALFTTI